jgi:hypothetical protein
VISEMPFSSSKTVERPLTGAKEQNREAESSANRRDDEGAISEEECERCELVFPRRKTQSSAYFPFQILRPPTRI